MGQLQGSVANFFWSITGLLFGHTNPASSKCQELFKAACVGAELFLPDHLYNFDSAVATLDEGFKNNLAIHLQVLAELK